MNARPTWECHQIYYDALSKTRVLNSLFVPHERNQTNLKYYENDVILELYNSISTIKSDYIGTTSWRFAEKTRFSTIEFRKKIEKSLGKFDVIFFTPFNHIGENNVKRNKEAYPALYQLQVMFDKKFNFDVKFLTDKWTASYCNYWIAKKTVFNEYVETVLIPFYEFFENNSDAIGLREIKHAGKQTPIAPFVMELLMGYFVNKSKIPHTTIWPDRCNDFVESRKSRLHKAQSAMARLFKICRAQTAK
ncbi:MAG: hypothetical protein WCL16_04755 [bacterium]